MILSKHPLILPMFLIAAVSNFNPASAGTAFATRDELRNAVNTYCTGGIVDPQYGSIEDWDVSGITSMVNMFYDKWSCNPPIGDWDVSNVTNFSGMFAHAKAFNQDISNWNVGSGTNFYGMFSSARAFNQDISGWDVGSGINFQAMFSHLPVFNQDISGWDVSSGTNFFSMFNYASSFNQDISKWDVSSATTFRFMFYQASNFNQDISKWDVSSVTDFYAMFYEAYAFNQDISGWDVGSGINFGLMFYSATSFDQPSLYCKWYINNAFETGLNVCGGGLRGGSNCGWGETTCALPDSVTPSSVPSLSPSGSPSNEPSDAPSAKPSSIPSDSLSKGPTDSPSSDPSTLPSDSLSASPSELPSIQPSSNPSDRRSDEACATCGGDPHLKTFFGHSYSYHGQCDMVLLKSREFAAYAGLDIHIRTTRVDNAKVGYSYISGAAVKLGFDVLEVMEDGELILNGNAVSSPTTFAAGYPLRKTFKGNNNKIIVYDLDLTSIKGVHKPIQIRVNTKAKMIFVDVYGRFPDGLGLLGPPSDDSRMLARDGVTDLVGEWNSFGEEWQVRSDEPKLFHENRAPQYPQGCVYESSNTRAMTLRRRLMDGSAVTEKDAEGACSGSKGKSKEFCIADVMATGMLDLAEDEFYLIHE